MPIEIPSKIRLYSTRQQFVLFSFLVTSFFFCALQKRKKSQRGTTPRYKVKGKLIKKEITKSFY